MTRAIPVRFVVLPHVYLLDLAGVADTFRAANRIAQRNVFECTFHGVGTASSVETSIGLSLGALAPLPPVLEDGALVVLSGVTRMADLEGRDAARAARWLAATVGPRQRVASVCAGAFLVGQAGLLDGRDCTTHHEDCAALQKRFPRARVQHNRIFVVDGNLLTSAGVTAGVDLALHLVAEHAGPVVAARVARALVVYLRRTGSDAQLSPWFAFRNHLHPVVHRTQDAVIADPTRDWTLEALAAAAHASVRHLSRLFRDETGVTPLDYLRHVRVTIARERLTTTALSIERVAEEAGFRSAHHLRRAWRRIEPGSPSTARVAASP